jgi:asparagine synthase (glutamine-hydrolysing)
LDPLARLQHIDLKVYLPDDILVKADRMSMAHSLEVRVPYLDHRIVEFAASLPSQLKVRRFTKKYILKQTISRLLPAQVLKRKKTGFNVPIPMWLRRELREMMHDTLSPTRVKEVGFFNPDAVSALMRDHEEMRVDLSRNLWGLLVFMQWYNEYCRQPCIGFQHTMPHASHGVRTGPNLVNIPVLNQAMIT